PGQSNDVCVKTSAQIAPGAENGIETSSTSGLRSDRKVATMIRYTSAIAMTRASTNCVSTVDSWANTPPVEIVTPEGSGTFWSALLTSAWTALVLLPVMVPVMVASRSPPTRLIDCGPLT